MITALLMVALLALTLAGRAAAATVRVIKRGGQKLRRVTIDLWYYWYGQPGRKRHPAQERVLFGGYRKVRDAVTGAVGWVIRRFRGFLAGRGAGKSFTLARQVILLAEQNCRATGEPIWGLIFGRTLKEVYDKLLPEIVRQCQEIERDLGIPYVPEFDLDAGTLRWPFGAAAYLLSYESYAALQRARGYNAGWAVIDELEVARQPIDEVLAVVNFAVRDPDAPQKALCWYSTPKGYKGMPRLHAEAKKRGDPNWYLVHATIHDNPHLSAEDIATIKATIPSKRLWAQEGLAICVMPRHTVFPQYSDATHIRPHRWLKSSKTWISVDWGLAKAYIAAYKVNAAGDWFIARELKVTDTTRRRFRKLVRKFVREVMALDGGAAPYGMSCDRAVKSERNWLYATYHQVCGNRVLWLSPTAEFRVEWGCAIISSLLESDDGSPPKLTLSEALTSSTEFATMGIRGAFTRYTYEIGHDKETGEEVILDTPSKLNAADDPVDTLRYALVSTRHMPELHGGKPLAFLADGDEEKAEASPAGKRAAARMLPANDDIAWGAACAA